MEYQKKERIFAGLVLLLFLAAMTAHYLLSPWGYYSRVSNEEGSARTSLVEAALHWYGAKESDGSHKAIIDRYNTLNPLPEDYTMEYTDSWCAAFVTVSAMDAGLTHFIPPECSCERQINLFREIGRWEENDNAVPQPGDLIYYDWNVSRQGNSTGWSDHVGIVVGVKWPFLKVIEGNKEDDVSFRIIPLGHKTIRGYAKPDYSGL